MKKFLLILVMSVTMAVSAKQVLAQDKGVSKVDSLYRAFDLKSQARDYRTIGMDTIFAFNGGEFMFLEFIPGKKEFHGIFGADKFILNRGTINYDTQGERFTLSSRSINPGSQVAELKLEKLLQAISSSVRKK